MSLDTSPCRLAEMGLSFLGLLCGDVCRLVGFASSSIVRLPSASTLPAAPPPSEDDDDDGDTSADPTGDGDPVDVAEGEAEDALAPVT